MNKYNNMNQKKLFESVVKINDFKNKFPMLSFKDVDITFLSKSLEINYKDCISTIVLLELSKEKKFYFNVNDVKNVEFKKNNSNWKIKIEFINGNKSEYMSFEFDK